MKLMAECIFHVRGVSLSLSFLSLVKTQTPIDILITFERSQLRLSRKMNESSRGHVVCKQSASEPRLLLAPN